MKKYSRVFSCIVLFTIITTLLTGCGEIQKAETTVNKTFAALKSLDFESASNHLNVDEIMTEDESSDSLSLDDKLFMQNLFGKLEHEILSSEKIDNNAVVVKTKITAIDMKPVLGEYITKALQYAFANAFADPQPTEEETNKKMEELFVECISKEDLATVTNEVDIKVVKTDKGWNIESTDELSNALLGGLAEAAEELNNSFNTEE